VSKPKRAKRSKVTRFTVTLIDGPAQPTAKAASLSTELGASGVSSEVPAAGGTRAKQAQRTDGLKPTRTGFEVNIVQLARHLMKDAHEVVTRGASAAAPGSAIRDVLELYADRVGREQANYSTATLVYTAVRAAHGELSAEAALRFARAARRENEWKGPNGRPVSAKTITKAVAEHSPSSTRGMVGKVRRIYGLLASGSLALVQPTGRRDERAPESLEQIIARFMKLHALSGKTG
jgi:hypothetical protein